MAKPEEEFQRKLLETLGGMAQSMQEMQRSAKVVESVATSVRVSLGRTAISVGRMQATLDRIERELMKKESSSEDVPMGEVEGVEIPIEDRTSKGGSTEKIDSKVDSESESEDDSSSE